MRTYTGKPGHTLDGTPDVVENFIITQKETRMAKNRKKSTAAVVAAGPTPTKRGTIAMRFARTLAATVIGFAATWLAGPDAAALITDPTQQALLAGILVPMLVALDKSLRYGTEKGEDPADTLL